MGQKKERIDKLLLERGLVETRSKGQAMIMAGEILVDKQPVTKAGQQVPADAEIEVLAPAPYVSRGGYKLSAALDHFGIVISDRVCADIGACTGGFTDVLLQRDAFRVYAIDVGYGQLDWKLRNDSRVVVLERTNARHLQSLPELVSFIAVDVSFISLRLVLPTAAAWLDETGEIVCLVKPQFEAGRENVGKGGIVRDPAVHKRVLNDILQWAAKNDLTPMNLIRSPIKGSSGNVEFLVHLKPGAAADNVIKTLIQGVIVH
jgi:23S rRNA (cytidine1920-2'-O)/16S rRNA (cytidine1409-2'-O)-methyltransferase